MTAVLEARGLRAGYGSVPVADHVDLEVGEGEVICLLGANGAGKTTTMMTLAGVLPALGGEVRWLGQPTSEPLHRRARQGLALIGESRSIFPGLTARGNLRLGRGDPDDAVSIFPELEPLLDRLAGLLSGGEQQMLTLGLALAARPRLLLADELSLGLAPIVVQRLVEAVRRAADAGSGVLLVEQQARVALQVADRAYVMQRGRVVASGPARDFLADIGELQRAYL